MRDAAEGRVALQSGRGGSCRVSLDWTAEGGCPHVAWVAGAATVYFLGRLRGARTLGDFGAVESYPQVSRQ
jgi:hypothetical protein